MCLHLVIKLEIVMKTTPSCIFLILFFFFLPFFFFLFLFPSIFLSPSSSSSPSSFEHSCAILIDYLCFKNEADSIGGDEEEEEYEEEEDGDQEEGEEGLMGIGKEGKEDGGGRCRMADIGPYNSRCVEYRLPWSCNSQ